LSRCGGVGGSTPSIEIIDTYYTHKKQNKIIKDKLKELTKKLNV
jgi:hypothetical protein